MKVRMGDDFDERRVRRFVERNPKGSTPEVMGALLMNPKYRDDVEQIITEIHD